MWQPTPLDLMIIGVGFFAAACLSGWAFYGAVLLVGDFIEWVRGK